MMQRIKITIFVIIVLVTLPVSANFFTYDRAVYDAQQEKWEKVQPALTSLLVENPSDPVLLFDNGMVAYNQKEWTQASAYFEAVCESGKASTELTTLAAIQQGNCYVALKELSKALKCYKKALEQEPTNQYAEHNKDAVEKMMQESEHDSSNDKSQEDNPNQDNPEDSAGDNSENNKRDQKESNSQNNQSDNKQNDQDQDNQSEDKKNESHGSPNQKDSGSSSNDKDKKDNTPNNDEGNKQNARDNNSSTQSAGKQENNESDSASQEGSNSQKRLPQDSQAGSQDKQNRKEGNSGHMNETQKYNQEQKRNAAQNAQDQFNQDKHDKEGQEKKNHESPRVHNTVKDTDQNKEITDKNQLKSAVPISSQEKKSQDPWIQYILQKQEESDRSLNKKMMEARVAGTAGELDGKPNW